MRDPIASPDDTLGHFIPNQRIVASLEALRNALNLPRHKVRVLDWGCGSGALVSWLCTQGYDAFGVDINPIAIAAARGKATAQHDDIDRFRAISTDCRTDFPDEYFHFTCSHQVLEHVENLEAVASELVRVTIPHGTGYHSYPAPFHLREVHLGMPFVHWLPKTSARKLAITAFVCVGIEPKWKTAASKSRIEKADLYYDYSINNTHYRSWAQVRITFANAGFAVDSAVLAHPRVLNHPVLQMLAGSQIMNPLLHWGLVTFAGQELSLTKLPPAFSS
jgi:SAM-dependent methyltransferase